MRKVLVVDDSRSQRMMLSHWLEDGGFEVLEAESGAEALEICAGGDVDAVLSDWMMPGMTGIELCRELRARQPGGRYIYFILLTSRTDKAAVAEGLEVGADDYLTKPVDGIELRARIRAGERLIAMERELRGNNGLLTDALERLRELYNTLDRDLAEARNLQLSLVPQRSHDLGSGKVSLRLRSSGHVGGDMVGYFEIDRRRMGLYAIDVSGHGAAAALLTTRMAGLFSGSSAEQNIAIRMGPSGPEGRSPAMVASAMNSLMLSELQTERYLTLCYLEIDRESGRLRFVQAGHPHPLLQHADGSVERLGSGGLPVGLIEEASWEDESHVIRPGQRLVLASDGVMECPGRDGSELGHLGLARMLERLAGLKGQSLIEGLIWELTRWAGTDDLPDDVSYAIYEHEGFAVVTGE